MASRLLESHVPCIVHAVLFVHLLLFYSKVLVWKTLSTVILIGLGYFDFFDA